MIQFIIEIDFPTIQGTILNMLFKMKPYIFYVYHKFYDLKMHFKGSLRSRFTYKIGSIGKDNLPFDGSKKKKEVGIYFVTQFPPFGGILLKLREKHFSLDHKYQGFYSF